MRVKASGRITKTNIDIPSILAKTNDAKTGGTVLFIGTVRDHSEAGDVDRIVYDAYVPMAEKRMLEIEEEVKEILPEGRVAMLHRIGELKVGEVSVAVAVSAPHRAEAFDACRHTIERIKHDVPIWKKERLADGREKWVEGRPMGKSRKTRPGSR